jgi:hypothetical protein
MENWGLVTYKETRLLVDTLQTSESVKQKVALTVGHEFAHQWFGNLVTMVIYIYKSNISSFLKVWLIYFMYFLGMVDPFVVE